MPLPPRLLDLVVGDRHQPVGDGRRLHRAHALGLRPARLDLAVGLLGERARFVRLDVARHHQNGVLGRIEALVIGERVLAVQALDLVPPADDRNPVRMMGEERRLHRLAELRAGIGVAMHAPLLEHHVALGRDDVVGEGQAGHAVGFERHAGLEVLLGDLLEIGGEIVAGEGVLHAADLGDEFRELALGMALRAFEHEMFEEMGDAGFARRIVGRAVAVPDHVGDDRRAMIGNDDDVEAVRKREIRHLRRGRSGRRHRGPIEVGGRRRDRPQGGAIMTVERHIRRRAASR